MTIHELQSNWHKLQDLDRSAAISFIYQSGLNLQRIAALLNCSAALLSRLMQAGQAPQDDQELARAGALSTRALVRRAKAAGTHRANRHREEIAYERERDAYLRCTAGNDPAIRSDDDSPDLDGAMLPDVA